MRRIRPAMPTPGRWPGAIAAALVVAMLVVALPTTWVGYRVEKITDWSAVCRYLNAEVAPGDQITGDGYFDGTLSWCFRQGAGAPVVRSDGKTLAEVAATERTVWYLAIGGDEPSREATFLAQGFARIPRSAWARADMVSPLDGCAMPAHFTFPQSEGPVAIYVARFPRQPAPPASAIPGECASR
jgi:hypothetical protein